MGAVRVHYHHEDQGWWAESDDVAGWTAVADTYEGLRVMVHDSLREFCGEEVIIEELGVPALTLTGVFKMPGSTRAGLQVQQRGETVFVALNLNVLPVTQTWRTVEAAQVTSEDDHVIASAR